MISIHFSETPVVDFETAAAANGENFKTFFHGMLGEGIYIAPSAFETWFLCDALSYQDLDKTIEAAAKVVKHFNKKNPSIWKGFFIVYGYRYFCFANHFLYCSGVTTFLTAAAS